MSTSYVTPAQLSKWRLSHQCGVINETTDLTWISPVFPLRFCLFQDRVQDITLSSIVLSPWSPPSVTVSVLFFTTLTIWKTASRIFCGMSLNLGLPHAPPPQHYWTELMSFGEEYCRGEVPSLPHRIRVYSDISMTYPWWGSPCGLGIFIPWFYTHFTWALVPHKVAIPFRWGPLLCLLCVSSSQTEDSCCGPARSRKNTLGPHDSMSI